MINSTDILSLRESRARFQEELVKQWNLPLIVIKANVPGSNKYDAYLLYTVMTIANEVLSMMPSVFTTRHHTAEGCIVYIVCPQDANEVKLKMLTIEESHPLGRIVDIDVLSQKGVLLSRRDFGHSVRSCYLCELPAYECTRNQTHSIHDIKRHIERMILNHIQPSLENQIAFALLAEVSASPKFGLVTPFSAGIHTDMNIDTFIDSIAVISKEIAKASEIKFRDWTSYFNDLRAIGKVAEQKMFEVTKGINTHKGAVFTLLMIIGGWWQCRSIEMLTDSIQLLAVSIHADFEEVRKKVELTEGEKQYITSGNKGIRGLALAGYSPHLIEALNYYRKLDGDLNEKMVKTLLFLMSRLDDTTVIKRIGEDGLIWLKQQSLKVLEENLSWFDFDSDCLQRNCSGGGSADMLSAVILLDLLEKKEREVL